LIDDLAAGDLDGDGIAEFVALWNGVEVLDRYGTLKWRQGVTFGHQVEVVDTDGDGKNEIALATGDLVLRDSRGIVTGKVKLPAYVAHFDICPLPESARAGILAVEDGYVWLVGFDGKVAAKYSAPLSKFESGSRRGPILESTEESVYKAKGTLVKLDGDQRQYLVVVTEFAALDRSVLYVYTTSGQLVYQEVLPECCTSVAALPAGNAGPQGFLIGGDHSVWMYKR
jgi:hypothetical protein